MARDVPPGLHAVSRNDPEPLGQIDFIPPRADHLASARPRENGKFQRLGPNPVLPSELSYKRGNLGIGQRRMMLDLPHPGLFGQQVLEMALPPRWVLA